VALEAVFAAFFLDDPEMNLFPGKVVHVNAKLARLFVEIIMMAILAERFLVLVAIQTNRIIFYVIIFMFPKPYLFIMGYLLKLVTTKAKIFFMAHRA
jgi:hypothetical protein